jgi:hypothetical protein
MHPGFAHPLVLPNLVSDMATCFFFRGVRIIREGNDYYLIYQGEIQRYLGSRQDVHGDGKDEPQQRAEEERRQVSDRILFFLGGPGDSLRRCQTIEGVSVMSCPVLRNVACMILVNLHSSPVCFLLIWIARAVVN